MKFFFGTLDIQNYFRGESKTQINLLAIVRKIHKKTEGRLKAFTLNIHEREV